MKKNKKSPVKIIGERDINLNLSNPEDHKMISDIGRALSSLDRLKILDMLKNKVMSIYEISETLKIPYSTAALHIKNLEEAKLIISESQPGKHGTMRVCTSSLQSLHINAHDTVKDSVNNTISMDMPIGNYYQCAVQATCGIADENGIIDVYDDERSFFSPLRFKTQLLWFNKGYVEYRFPNINKPQSPLHEISFSMEICSEAPGFHEDWPSDITISINDTEVSTYTSPGDYGARRGNHTPASWPNRHTQHGILKTFSVRKDGSYIDGNLVNKDVTLEQLSIGDSYFISLKVEIKDDAKHIGGINIFGEKFGDYPQGITMNLIY